jgi:hypothetical protein
MRTVTDPGGINGETRQLAGSWVSVTSDSQTVWCPVRRRLDASSRIQQRGGGTRPGPCVHDDAEYGGLAGRDVYEGDVDPAPTAVGRRGLRRRPSAPDCG